MSSRIQVNEQDLSTFPRSTIDETGAIVVTSAKGPNYPIKCESESDVLKNFGNPSALYPEVFEAIAYSRSAPIWVASAIGEGALYGGVDVSLSGVTGFGTGRDLATFDYDSLPEISHSFFAKSPYADDLSVKIKYLTGKQFKMTLSKIISTGYSLISEYTYSLNREKDAFGRSLYIFDVFDDNDYVVAKVNTDFAGTAYTVDSLDTDFDGGTRGNAPQDSDYLSSWNNFQLKGKYPVTTFIDAKGNSAVTINTLINTYQNYAHGISVVPLGNTAAEAKTVREDLGLNTNKVSLYTNWSRIKDSYNNSSAWISNAGSVGRKYAMMNDVFDGEAPAGIDQNNHGGLLSDWEVIEMENSYTDAEMTLLNNAQINPIIKDPVYGLMAYGNNTLQVTPSDTSFIGHRRLFNYIIKNVKENILVRQVFRLNNAANRLSARIQIESLLNPIVEKGVLNDFYVVCDETNNTGEVLSQRKFIIDLYVQVVPDAEYVQLNMIFVGQTVSISELI